ncbi:MAG: glycosyltransferase [Streptosporangiales bacterium]|nr:glycosyltransferase [Streptosporangiales bacterium]
MLARFAMGLPSFNEADTIATVTADVDAALQSLPFDASAVVVNADNSSPDGTAETFLRVPTAAPKQVITTPYRAGKGANVRALLEFAREDDCDGLLLVDSDLAEVPTTWIHALLGEIRGGAEFCYPLRAATWNGGDLTYHLAYPILAGAFGIDLREPLCGEVAISRRGVDRLLHTAWHPEDSGFGVDLLMASVAARGGWTAVQLHPRRRNKLRSFSPDADGLRMGAKFAESAAAARHRVGDRLAEPPPAALVPSPADAPPDTRGLVPLRDPDIEQLSAGTTRWLRDSVRDDSLAALPAHVRDGLAALIRCGDIAAGLPWPLWRDCLIAWISEQPSASADTPVSLLETLFLARVVGHHTEIAGRTDWYATVRAQARDMFDHRHGLWNAFRAT